MTLQLLGVGLVGFGLAWAVRATLAMLWARKVRRVLARHQFSDDAFAELFDDSESIWDYRR